jgi:hypothetical protein
VVSAVRGTGADRVDGVSGGRAYSVVRRPPIDLRFSIEDRTFVICEGERNTLDGEDFTCPVEDPVNSRTGSPFPMARIGVAVGKARLRFRDGQVAEANAEESQDHLAAEACTPDPRDEGVGCRMWNRNVPGTVRLGRLQYVWSRTAAGHAAIDKTETGRARRSALV